MKKLMVNVQLFLLDEDVFCDGVASEADAGLIEEQFYFFDKCVDAGSCYEDVIKTFEKYME